MALVSPVFDAASYAFNPYALPPLLVGILAGLVGLAVLIRERGSSASIVFCSLTSSGFLWLASYGGIYSATHESVSLWWARVENIGVVFLPSLLFLFTLVVTRRLPFFRFLAWLSLGVSAFLAFTVVLTDWFIAGMYRYPWGYYVKGGFLTLPFLAFFFTLMAASLSLYWRECERAVLERHKQRLRSFLIAFAVAQLGSMDCLAAYGLSVYPAGYLPALLSILLLARSIWRHHLADISPALAAEQIINTMADPLVVVDRDGVIRIANPAACHLFRKTESELVGTFVEQVSKEFFSPEPFEQLIQGKLLRNSIVRMPGRKGEPVVLNLLAFVMHDPTKQPVAVVYLARDITERERAEEAILQKTVELERSYAERDQLELFAYIASHDLREPLQKIIAFGDLLQENCARALDEKGRDYLDRMTKAALRLSQLIQDLLRFVRVSTQGAPFEPVDFEQVVREVLSDLEFPIRQSGAEIEIESLPTLAADRVQIRELFQNLIANAVKFSKEGERPCVRIKSRETGNGLVEITVEDRGIGFDESEVERIFRPFERLHPRERYEGSGMGLSICKKIVERHGGKITARSELGKGSSFVIIIGVSR